MMGVFDIMEDKLKQLAESLKKTGLALTDAEAFEKARGMIETEEKVSEEKGVKKDKLIDGFDEDKPISEVLDED
tara:strand:- start:414 stop:635 length:222 start_codon:yes stop_codon:yes gene_type:complete